jgi:hypothetical protein
LEKVISKSQSKSCELDPIPTWLLKECLEELLPSLTKIITAPIFVSVSELILSLIPSILSMKKSLKFCAGSFEEEDVGSAASSFIWISKRIHICMMKSFSLVMREVQKSFSN